MEQQIKIDLEAASTEILRRLEILSMHDQLSMGSTSNDSCVKHIKGESFLLEGDHNEG